MIRFTKASEFGTKYPIELDDDDIGMFYDSKNNEICIRKFLINNYKKMSTSKYSISGIKLDNRNWNDSEESICTTMINHEMIHGAMKEIGMDGHRTLDYIEYMNDEFDYWKRKGFYNE